MWRGQQLFRAWKQWRNKTQALQSARHGLTLLRMSADHRFQASAFSSWIQASQQGLNKRHNMDKAIQHAQNVVSHICRICKLWLWLKGRQCDSAGVSSLDKDKFHCIQTVWQIESWNIRGEKGSRHATLPLSLLHSNPFAIVRRLQNFLLL